MTDITHNIRDWNVILNDDREIPITEWQKEALTSMINDKMPLVEIFDIDTKRCLFSWKRTSIKEFRQKISWYGERKYICMYWIRHYPNEECNCYDLFKTPYWKFYDWLTSMNYKFENTTEIQKEWIQEFLNK